MTRSPERPSSADERIAELLIELQDSRPPIWRRVQVPAGLTLGDLHHVLQIVMDWEEAHLHRFEVRGKSYALPSPWSEPDVGERDEDADSVTLWDLKLAVPGRSFSYLYDFGDDWFHRITCEDAAARKLAASYPRCVAGERAAPPEDVGGVYRYGHLVEVLADPEHPEHDEAREWVPEGFDPGRVDLDRINRRLERAFGASPPAPGE